MHSLIIKFVFFAFFSFHLFAAPFEFYSSKGEWEKSSDFPKALNHYKGPGTSYEIRKFGKYQVVKHFAETRLTQLTFSHFESIPLCFVMRDLKNSKDTDQRDVSFNGRDEITYSVINSYRTTILHLQLNKKP